MTMITLETPDKTFMACVHGGAPPVRIVVKICDALWQDAHQAGYHKGTLKVRTVRQKSEQGKVIVFCAWSESRGTVSW